MRLAIAIAALMLAFDAASAELVGSACAGVTQQYWSAVASALPH